MMLNDRIALPRFRRALDLLLGEFVADTLVLRISDLLKVRSAHFASELSRETRQELFLKSVRSVEIETHSFCNRTCWFCPNSTVDRHSTCTYLPEAVYLQLLEDLRSVGYKRVLSFCRYNEPFGADVIYERIAQARSSLPRCCLQANSNGDYLDAKKLVQLSSLGFNRLFVAAYPPNGTPWTTHGAELLIARLARRLQLPLRRRHETRGFRIGYQVRLNGMLINMYSPNIAAFGVDRGGTVKGLPVVSRPRVSPCLLPATRVYIDYTGHMMPCCNLRSDIEEHISCSFGKVDERPGSIWDVWGGPVAANWRRGLTRFGAKQRPCAGCRDREWATSPMLRMLFQALLRTRK